MQAEITDRVHTEEIGKIVRVKDVPLGLRHLAARLQKPRMTEDLLRQRLAESHQEDRPVDGMEADDVLSDEVQVRGPVLLIEVAVVSVRVVAQAGGVVAQSIQPHIDHVLRVEVHRDAPLEAGAGHAEILQPRQQEVVHHLVLSGDGLDELRMTVDVLDQTVRILTHTEEVSLLLCRPAFAPAVRTLAVHQL